MKKRRWLKPKEARLLGFKVKKNQPNRKDARYMVYDHDYNKILEARNQGILDAHDEHQVDPTQSKFLWLKNKNSSIPVQNPFYEERLEKTFKELSETFEGKIKGMVKKSVKRSKIKPKSIDTDFLFDVAIYTDVHVGMDPNPTGHSLYGGKWDEVELQKRNEKLVEKIIQNKKSNRLFIFDLGDLMDGWNAETVRKGHHLPQNMSNEKAHDVALDFKISQIDYLASQYEDITIININDDNHSGAFAYVVNSPFKLFIEERYDNVKVINQRKFIDHYIIDNKVFVATHGKDGKNLKFGFKPILCAKQIEKIENYLYENDLVRKDYEIFFIKGDSHQDILDNSTSQKFKYWNFPAFSPSSNWVQTNFKKGVSGFYTFNFEEDCYHPHPYYFNWY